MFDRKIKSTKKTVPVKLLDTEEMLYGSTSSYMERKTMDVILIRCRNSSLFVAKKNMKCARMSNLWRNSSLFVAKSMYWARMGTENLVLVPS